MAQRIANIRTEIATPKRERFTPTVSRSLCAGLVTLCLFLPLAMRFGLMVYGRRATLRSRAM